LRFDEVRAVQTVVSGVAFKEVNKNVKNIVLSMCDVREFLTFTALTTILPILFQYCYKYCYSDSRNL